MLHLAGGIALGVDVRELLELQSALQGHRVLDTPRQVQEVAVPEVAPGQRLALRVKAGENRGDQVGHAGQVLQKALETVV